MKLLLFMLLVIVPICLRAQWSTDVRLTNDDWLSHTSYNNARCIATNGDTIHVV